MEQFSWADDVLPVVQKLAQQRFARRPDRDERTVDAVSLSWEASQDAPPQATPATIAYYAVRRADCGRQFAESIRSIDGPASRDCEKPERVEYDTMRVIARSGDPAEIAAFRLDFAAWLATLSDRQRTLVVELASGERPRTAAIRFGCTPARVSQLRRELCEDWQEFRS